jgi:hypothetical protein
MSRKSLASRSRTPKPAEVVPISPTQPWGPVKEARHHFEVCSEMTTLNLKGLRMVLDAWSVFERESSLAPDARDYAMMFLGDAVELMGDRLEAKRLAWNEAEKAEAVTQSA